MSGGNVCKCGEHLEPIKVDPIVNRPGRLWRVVQRQCNHSAFNGYHATYSDYSSVSCLRCGSTWRTKAGYVHELNDLVDTEQFVAVGYAGHRDFMAVTGRELHPHDPNHPSHQNRRT